jgi:hypothetical protein
MTLLSEMLVKQIDLIMEGYNVDDSDNLVPVNKKKIAEADKIFHKYFVTAMNNQFRKLNEHDPIMGIHSGEHGHMGDMNPMGDMDMGADMDFGTGHEDHDGMGDMGEELGLLGDDMDMDGLDMGHGHMDHMGAGHNMHMDGDDIMGGDDLMGDMHHMDHMGESFDWINENPSELNIDSFFNLIEEEGEEDEDVEECNLNEFNGLEDDEFEGGDNDFGGGDEDAHPGYGGDMGGVAGSNDHGMEIGGGGDDDMDLDSSLDSHDDEDNFGGNEFGGEGDDDMITIHGHTDNGGEFSFSFDKDTLGFDDNDAGGDEFGNEEEMHGGEEDNQFGNDDFGGDEENSDFGDEDQGDMMAHSMDQPGDGYGEEEDDEHNMAEAASHKPGRTTGLDVVPKNRKTSRATPMGTPMGTKQKNSKK